MTIFQAIILGIVEGVTEFLPISSTGHMILVSRLLAIPQTEFVKSFEIIIQLGAIAAVFLLYGKRIITDRSLIKPLLLAFIPTATAGFILYKIIKTFLIGNAYITLVSLFVGGIVLLIIEPFAKKINAKELTPLRAFIIGCFQILSVIPGVSRSAATITGGMIMGISKKEAVEFSFLLAIPTMVAATGLDLVKTRVQFSGSEVLLLLIGLIVAFGSAYAAVKTFLRYVGDHSFAVFGIYRILLAALLFLLRVY